MKELPLFEPLTGIVILTIYALVVFLLTYFFSRGYSKTKVSFLLSNRDLTSTQGKFSVAAAWLYATGLFVSVQQAYVNGLVGFFWFVLGAIGVYWLFGFFAQKLRDKFPEGFTFSSYIKETYGTKVQSVYLFEMSLLAICICALNLLAGGKIIELLTGLNFYFSVIVIAVIALIYSLNGGLKASVVTEIFKILMVWSGIFILVPLVVLNSGGINNVINGLSGINKDGLAIIGTEKSWNVFITFGIITFLGAMGGFFGDNAFYQRSFSIPKEKVFKTFWQGSLVYGIIPLGMSLIGFAAAGSGLIVPKGNEQMTTAYMIANTLPSFASIYFLFIFFACSISVLDSQLTSISSMAGHDIINKYKNNISDKDSILFARGAMILMTLLGILISFIPGITILHIFLFFATLRSSVWIPSIVAIVRPKLLNSNSMFYGILIAIFIGLPLFVYGNLTKQPYVVLSGVLIAILGSFLFSFILKKLIFKGNEI